MTTPFQVTRPVRLKLHGEARTWQAGEVLTLDPAQAEAVKASPLADAFRPLTPAEVLAHNEAARGEIDAYFSGPIMAALARLFQDGRLPEDGLSSPEWREVEAAWQEANEDSPSPCDVEKVKRLMAAFIRSKGGTIPEVPARKVGEVQAVTIRHKRTGQTAVILSTVLDSWLADGWERIETKPASEHGPKQGGSQ